MKISVVLPCYNVATYIPNVVKSLENQTFTDFEALFINDGSTDHIENVFDQLNTDNRFQLIHQENQGSGMARNHGLKLAKGEYVYFLDPDDEITPTLFEDLVPLMDNSQADLAIFGYNMHYLNSDKIIEKSPRKKGFVNKQKTVRKKLLELAHQTSILAVWNKLYRKSFLLENNLKSSALPVGQDAEFNWRVLNQLNSLVVVDQAYYIYSVNRSGSVRTNYNKNQFCSEIKILETMIETLSTWDFPEKSQQLTNDYKIDIAFGEILNRLRTQDYHLKNILSQEVLSVIEGVSYHRTSNIDKKYKLFLLKHPLIFKMVLWLRNIFKNKFRRRA